MNPRAAGLSAEEDLELLALKGLNSLNPIEPGLLGRKAQTSE
jgi:hypothetical protein